VSSEVQPVSVDRPVVVPATPRVVETHEIRILDGRFAAATCSCGWRSAARRHRSTVRSEARDHSLLYADGRLLTITDET
jgi:hypothetical protein